MLRLGHLKVLLQLASRAAGNRARLARRLAETLTAPVEIASGEIVQLGTYLMKKNLATVSYPNGEVHPPRTNARYKTLTVHLDLLGKPEAITTAHVREPPTVWFQDRFIADDNTRSKLGAVTVDTRQVSNKSGVSHLVDWLILIGAANSRLGVTAMGRAALAAADAVTRTSPESSPNPYVIGGERVAFASLLFGADGDVLLPLITKASKEGEITKQHAIALITEVADGMATDLRAAGTSPSPKAGRALREFRADLGIDRPRRASQPKASSTAWHRVSSRLESLTDLGFLEKRDEKGKRREFDYYYRPTAVAIAAAETISTATSAADWTENHLVSALHSVSVSPNHEDCSAELFQAVGLAQGPTGLHIDAFAAIAASLALSAGKHLSLGEARRKIVTLAIENPTIATLTRGYSGSRAEFASVSYKNLDKVGPPVFTTL